MKIIDAFMFFDELDLLEVRLNELNPIVDHFVIVESLERFGSCKPKSAFLQENWNVVKSFEHKIKYVLLPHLEPTYTDKTSGWQREAFQRNAMLPAVLELSTSSDDIVLISDCDEIPRAEAVCNSLNRVRGGLHYLSLDLFWYNVNRYLGLW